MSRFHTFRLLENDHSTCIDLDKIYRIEPVDHTGYGVKVWPIGREEPFRFAGPWDVWIKMLVGEDGTVPNQPAISAPPTGQPQ